MRIGVIVLAISIPLLAQNLPQGASLDIKVQKVQGDADCRLAADGPWAPVQKGMSLNAGTEICTAAGAEVWIDFGTNGAALVRESSDFRIDSFRMEGNRLVARVRVDPGVVSVSVSQLPQFITDFQVSTPRLTASVRGSGETVVANGDEIPDSVYVDEDFARIAFRSGERMGVLEGGETNSDKALPIDLTSRESLVDVIPQEATPRERASTDSAVWTAESADNLASDQTRAGNPVTRFLIQPEAPPIVRFFRPERALQDLILTFDAAQTPSFQYPPR